MVYSDFSWPLGQLCQVRSMCSGTGWTQELSPWETGEIRALKVHLEFQVEWVYFILLWVKGKMPLLRPSTFATSYFTYHDPPGDCQTHPMIWPEPWNKREQAQDLKTSLTHTHQKDVFCVHWTGHSLHHPTNSQELWGGSVLAAESLSSWRRKRFSFFCQLWNWALSKQPWLQGSHLMTPRLSWTSLSL